MASSLLRAGLAGLALLAAAANALAQVTTERGASILIYPKVVADASGDTLLQLVNLSESRVFALCNYVDGTSWQAQTFTLEIDAHRPLVWTASRGRTPSGDDSNDIPAATAGFRGELLCVQIDQTGAALSGNQLAGGATLAALDGGDVDAYAAVGLLGLGFNDGDDQLCIGGDFSDVCLIGAEYDPCPAEWRLNHPAENAADAQLGDGSRLGTRLSIVPCSQNVRDGEPSTVTVQLLVTNEFEQRLSASASVRCWADLSLADIDGAIFDRGTTGSDALQTMIRPAPESGAFVLIAEIERRAAEAGPIVDRSAVNPHQQGGAIANDLIVLPMVQP